MKKSLIALAALSAFATAAQAQSSVTVYGIIDTGYNSLENNVSGTKTTTKGVVAGAGEASSSRLGFRGTEDLGGGLKATFVVEGGMAQTAAFSFDRAYWVGLENAKLGELRIGRQDSFVRSVWLGADQLAAANVAGNLAHNGNGAGAATTSHTARSVAANYFTPRMSGVQLSAGLMQANTETTTTAKNGTGSQFGLNYVAGKFTAAVAQAKFTQNLATGTGLFADGDGSDSTSFGIPTVAAIAGKVKELGAAASYDLGVAKVAYIYNDRDIATGEQRKSHALSASIPVSAKLVARLGYGFGDVAASESATKYDIKGMQAALNYNLSKRTTAYAIYGDEKRETSATAQTKSKEYSVGVRHSF